MRNLKLMMKISPLETIPQRLNQKINKTNIVPLCAKISDND